jgi:hypothetical protein
MKVQHTFHWQYTLNVMNEIVLMNKITNAEMGDMNCVKSICEREKFHIDKNGVCTALEDAPCHPAWCKKTLDHVVLLLASVFALPSL